MQPLYNVSRTLLLAAFSVLFLFASLAPDEASGQNRLIISQYVDTNSGTTPKGIELWNVSGGTIDFSTDNLTVNRYANGSSSPTVEFTLTSGTLGAGDVIVVGGSDLQTYMSNNAPSVQFYNDSFSFNGNDALDVVLGGSTEDVFGTIGSDPGSAWTGNGVSTADQNIQLLSSVSSGTTSGFTDPSTRFETAASDPTDLTGFGVAPGGGASNPTVEFTSGTQTVSETDGTVTLTVVLNNPDGNAVDVDVAFDAGSSSASTSDVGGYSTQTVTFSSSASDGATQDVTVTLTDDNDAEPNEDAVFELTNLTTSGSAQVGAVGTFTLTITDDDQPLVINEIHADPASGSDGDANGDGTRDGSEDEFVEIYNDGSSSVDLSGYTIEDGVGLRHTFPAGTVLDPGVAVVVFGGGSPTGIPAVVQTASEGFLGFNNGGDDVILKDDGGNVLTSVTYGSEGGDNQSLTRDPDFTGSFVKHSLASGSGGALYSPGQTVDGTVLPVELTSFDVTASSTTAQLVWTTASETNNSGFAVQHRAPGQSWSEIGFVDGAGTTAETTTYRFETDALETGTHTFRLKQIDLDGTPSLSKKQTVQIDAAQSVVLRGPNPIRRGQAAQLRVTVDVRQSVEATLYNVLGQEVRALHRGPLAPGQPLTKRVTTDGLSSGLYFVRVTGESFQHTRRLTVLR